MTGVKVTNGRLVVSKDTAAKGNSRPRKYPFPQEQFNQLLKIAKAAGVDTGTKKAQETRAVNLVVKAALDDFIASQSKSKVEPKAEK